MLFFIGSVQFAVDCVRCARWLVPGYVLLLIVAFACSYLPGGYGLFQLSYVQFATFAARFVLYTHVPVRSHVGSRHHHAAVLCAVITIPLSFTFGWLVAVRWFVGYPTTGYHLPLLRLHYAVWLYARLVITLRYWLIRSVGSPFTVGSLVHYRHPGLPRTTALITARLVIALLPRSTHTS